MVSPKAIQEGSLKAIPDGPGLENDFISLSPQFLAI
jgi:hypothetical protein